MSIEKLYQFATENLNSKIWKYDDSYQAQYSCQFTSPAYLCDITKCGEILTLFVLMLDNPHYFIY